MTSRRKSLRRNSGSIRVTRKSGRANANGIPGRPAPLPMSAICSPGLEQLGEGDAVEQVPVPQPVRFAGSDEAAFDAGAGQDLGVSLRAFQTSRRRARAAAGGGADTSTCFT